MRPFLGVLTVLGWMLAGQPSLAEERVDYLRQVKPLLAARCYSCHGNLRKKGGLRADTATFLKRGGDSGPAIVPGDSGDSWLIDRVTDEGGERMPPASEGEGLGAPEIALLKGWIDQGAVAPSDEQPEPDPRQHWAFRPPVRPAVPSPSESPSGHRGGLREAWASNPIDAFLAAEWEKHGMSPQPTADSRLLLRRVYLDLVGLPPLEEELDVFEADQSPDAYEKVVERLLGSTRYGERWGRHWMDIWRYSDWYGLGSELRNSQKHIWHWRDWIIESLNADKGYDRMIREMLAADELYPGDTGRLRATGFLARPYYKFNRNTWLEDVVENTGKAFLGLTFNCAKCHDHKYDPISQADYYRFRAFFEPYQVRTDQVQGEINFEKDGIPRAFDCNLDAPTYLFERGDEQRPLKDRPLKPGVPALLATEGLEIVPVSLPPEASLPGLRPFVLEDHLRDAEARIVAARAALDKARVHLADAEMEECSLLTVSPDGDRGKADRRSPVEWAKAEMELAEKTLAAVAAQPEALRARAAADRASYRQPPGGDAEEPAAQAARLEGLATLAKAEEVVAIAELALLRADAARQAAELKVKGPDAAKHAPAAADAARKAAAALVKKRDAAKDALVAARKAIEAPDVKYTPLRGALKTLESNVETPASRSRAFPTTSTGRRTALARWMTDRQNPLTARVAVNHIWTRHFGEPLVPTTFDFGRKGTPPTHADLLDWLAVELMDNRWSMKHMHRLIVLSAAYRRTSTSVGADAATLAADPENRWYWRANPARMESQVVRDSILHLAGALDPAIGGPSVPVKDAMSRRRSVYIVHSYNDHHKFLSMFDDASVVECYRRSVSIVPAQALALSNSRLALTMAAKINAHLHDRLGPTSDSRFARSAFEMILAGTPSPAELAECERALAELTALLEEHGAADAGIRARDGLVRALLNHNDFVTIR